MGITDEFEGKKILIWGFGREGQSTKHFLARCCKAASVEVYEGAREGIEEDLYDYIIKSPGIVMEEDHPKYISQTEIFLRAFRDNVVGITGTKGKSTTSAMLYHVLTSCGKKAILLGNIGEPCLDYFEEVSPDTIVVFEMSCHQLAHTDVSPRVAVFLSFFEEHLDYYKTVDKYYRAKSHVTTYQKPEDDFYVGEGVPMPQTCARVHSIHRADAMDFKLSILGDHNRYNATFVYKIATEIYGCDADCVKSAIESFTGLAHRLQYIGTKDDIRFYDDSISTIPSAAIEALHAIPNVKTILLGGMDRGIDYKLLVDFIPQHPEYIYIFAYDSGRRILSEVEEVLNSQQKESLHFTEDSDKKESLHCTEDSDKKESCHCTEDSDKKESLHCTEGSDKKENLFYTDDLEKATRLALELTPKGSACVLSPASASYGYFKNFEQRGEMFKEYIGEGLKL